MNFPGREITGIFMDRFVSAVFSGSKLAEHLFTGHYVIR